MWNKGYQWDYVFDWTILKYQQTQSRVPQNPGRLGGERQGGGGGGGGGAGAGGVTAVAPATGQQVDQANVGGPSAGAGGGADRRRFT